MSTLTRILIVEDSEDDSLLLSRQLLREIPGATFGRVDSEQNMLAALYEQDWDLVISDHSMPHFDSVRALKVLRGVKGDIPFIVYSGAYDEAMGVAAMSGGAADYLYKSAPQRLLPVVCRELGNAELRRAKNRAENSAYTLSLFDDLTGLPNHKLLLQKLQVRAAAAAPGAGAVACIDIDRFMRINDSFGFAAGNALLIQVAERLKAVLGSLDVLARLRGDRYACLLWTVADASDARDQAERMRAVFSRPFQENGQEFFLTASIGCALLPGHDSDAVSLLEAERAMATAKKNGSHDIEIFDPGLPFAAGFSPLSPATSH